MTRPAEWRLDHQHIGRRVLLYEEVDSTNTRAMALADDPSQDGLAILADSQTAGRGRHGRRWLCPPGAGVLLSVLLFPPPFLRRPVLLTAWSAVSVCEVVAEATGLGPRIKWPNDVLLTRRKICGILIEQGRAVVVGIGLNLHQAAEHFAAAGLEQAASLAAFACGPLDRQAIARRLLARLDEHYGRLLAGQTRFLEGQWQRWLGLLGRPVVMEAANTSLRGRLVGIRFDRLTLESPEGTVDVVPESVRQLREGI